jgi:hypothetical protein
MTGIKYEYRGHEISLNGNLTEDFKTLSIFYLKERRFDEALNAAVLHQSIGGIQNSLGDFFMQIIQAINEDTHVLRHLDQLQHCLAIVKFYGVSGIINAKDVFYMTGILRTVDLTNIRLKDKILFEQSLNDLEISLQDIFLQPWIWNSIDPLTLITAEVQIGDNDLDIFKVAFENYLSQLLIDFNDVNIPAKFEIVSVKKGSLIVEFTSYAMAIYGLARIIKSTISEYYSIKLEFHIQRKAIRLLAESNPKDLRSLQKDAVIARKIINKPSDDLLKNSTKLSSLFKRFNIYPNTLSNSGH